MHSILRQIYFYRVLAPARYNWAAMPRKGKAAAAATAEGVSKEPTSPETLKVDEDSKDQKTATTGKKRARTVKSGEKSLTETDKSTVAENNAPAETVEKSAKPKRQKASAKSGVEKSEDEKLVNKIADEEVEKEAVPKKRKTAAKSKKATVESAVEADDETLGNVETVEKPKKKRKPTAKQLEEAEAAARPRYDPEKDRPPPCTDLETITILGWNVTSLNATLRKDPDAISKLVNDNGADVICLQETKLQDKAIEEFAEKIGLPGWHYHWNCSQSKKGYSGTASISKTKPISVQMGLKGDPEHDDEGRVITLEFPQYYLVNVYTPNAGEGLKRLKYKIEQWEPTFLKFIASLKAKKPVVVTGDLNCAHQSIDIHSPRTNLKSAGYTPEERESFGKSLQALELTDCYRKQFPDHVGYTWWSIRTGARKTNKGWRLDYFLVTPKLVEKSHDCFILKDYGAEQNLGDHCPVGLVLKT